MEYRTTEAQRAKSRRCRDKRRAEQRCTRCGRQDARTLAGYSCCERCRTRLREYNDEHRAERQGQHIEYMRKWREARRTERRCTGCGKPLPEGETHTVCAKCRAKKAGWHKRRRNLHGSTAETLSRCPASADIKACLNCKRRRCVFDVIDKEVR